MTNTRPVIAIVDDDPRMLESLTDLLESGGYAARAHLSARELLEAGLSGIDAVVADISMPGMDGFALRDLLRTSDPNLSVFLITGRHELTEDARLSGADNVFRKPFNAGELLDAIANALRMGKTGGG